MAIDIRLLLLLLSTLTSASDAPTTNHPMQRIIESDQQLRNIIEALIGAGDFGSWANVLSVTDPSTFPLTATLFIPSDVALSHFPTSPSFSDPSLFTYHIVPQQLSFSDLQTLSIGSRLPTLLPSKTILITNNSETNYTIDESPITHPDLYANEAFSVHGIGSLLNYSLFDNKDRLPIPSSPASAEVNAPAPEAESDRGGFTGSDAPCLCTEFPIVLPVVLAVFVLKIHGYYSNR